jgi:hypothetical protein
MNHAESLLSVEEVRSLREESSTVQRVAQINARCPVFL